MDVKEIKQGGHETELALMPWCPMQANQNTSKPKPEPELMNALQSEKMKLESRQLQTDNLAFPNKATKCLSFGQSNNLLALLLFCKTPPLAPVSGKLFITFGLVLSNSNQHELK